MSAAPYLISTAIFRNVPKDLGRLKDSMKLIFFFFFGKGRLHIFVSRYQNTVQEFLPLKSTVCNGVFFPPLL